MCTTALRFVTVHMRYLKGKLKLRIFLPILDIDGTCTCEIFLILKKNQFIHVCSPLDAKQSFKVKKKIRSNNTRFNMKN